MPKGTRNDVERHANMCGTPGDPRMTNASVGKPDGYWRPAH